MLGDFVRDVLSLPLQVAKIPANVLAEIAHQIDPRDDAAIASAAQQLAAAINVPFEACERAIREALR